MANSKSLDLVHAKIGENTYFCNNTNKFKLCLRYQNHLIHLAYFQKQILMGDHVVYLNF